MNSYAYLEDGRQEEEEEEEENQEQECALLMSIRVR